MRSETAGWCCGSSRFSVSRERCSVRAGEPLFLPARHSLDEEAESARHRHHGAHVTDVQIGKGTAHHCLSPASTNVFSRISRDTSGVRIVSTNDQYVCAFPSLLGL